MNYQKSFFSSLLLVIGFIVSVPPAHSFQQSTQLTQHDLQCGEVFTCPPELQRRIDFWVQVFRLWSLEDRIFHDSRKPERIYSVVRTDDPCSRKRPKGRVKSEYNRIKLHLNNLAVALESGKSADSLKELPLANLFNTLNAQDLREAAKSVRCQSGNRERFETALEHFERYQGFILATLKQNGLPEDIQYLPFVESAFNPRAYSHVGAAGLWQIMPSTGRTLGLQVGSAVDERLEPELATMAAAQYFINSIKKLTAAAIDKGASTDQSSLNPFVITSYNYGVRGMERAIEQVGTDYMRLLGEYKSNSFRTAVRNFYASFLAARYVAKKRHFYFANINPSPKKPSQVVRLKKAAKLKQLQKALGVEKSVLKELNPSLTYRVWNNSYAIPRGYDLHLPLRQNGWSRGLEKLAKMPEPKGLDSGKSHRVRRGQTACGIANRHKVRCKDLLALNKLQRKSVIRVGQRLKVPGTGSARYVVSDTYQRGRKLLQRQSQSNLTPAVASRVSKQAIAKVAGANDASVSKTTQPALMVKSATAPLPNTTRLNFDIAVRQGKSNYYVQVLAGETLSHYSDWLGGGLSKLRKLNGYSSQRKIRFGSVVKLPINSVKQKTKFERQRSMFHQRISQDYYQRYRVNGARKATVKNGQTLWGIASKASIPMWLLHHYNPQLRTAKRGEKLTIPKVEKI